MSSNLKNVVIIGGAGGGAQVARDLEKSLPDTHRLILIEKNDFAYWPIGGLRAAVKPGKYT
jgi:NADH dehydrogenase FAD-containing subunit